ncbi:MAG: ABC transporter permease [Myxococcales bacterium]|nr:ABC transporter permease [Myxococcales bacterium]
MGSLIGSDLLEGAGNQMRVVHALALRETRTRFGQHRLGYLWALLEPTLWILTLYGAFTLAGRESMSGMELIPFLATGMVVYDLFSKSVEKVSAAIVSNKALLFYPHVKTLDIVFARGSLEFATYAIVFVILLGGHGLLVQQMQIHDLLLVITGFGLAALLGMGVGLLFCTLSVISNVADRIRGPLLRPLFWVSGIFFAADALPSEARDLLLWNPVLHCVEMVRSGWFESYAANYGSPVYVSYWILGLFFAGLSLERHVRPKVQLT